MIVDRRHRPTGDPAGEQAEQRAADDLVDEDLADRPCIELAHRAVGRAHREGQAHAERHHRDAVVEQRLAGDLGLDRFRHLHRLQQPEDCDWIGRRDQRAEHQRPGEWQLEAAEPRQAVEGQPDQHGREQHADRRHQPDRPSLSAQHVDVDMQGSCEQQERQHAIHDRRVEIDLADRRAQGVGDAEAGEDRLRREQHQRTGQRHDQQADRVRQSQDPQVEEAEQRRKGQQQRDDLEDGQHGGTTIRCKEMSGT